MGHSRSYRAALIGIAVLFTAPWATHAAQPTFPSGPPPATVCYCHNVNHHPHTICTADRAFKMGHQFHVNNGTDTLGECAPPPEPGCGNGALERGEECDDGNTVTEDCAYNVTETECTVCAADCTEQAGKTHFCGDGVVDTANGEECDGGEGCDASCRRIVPENCGNLRLDVDVGEQCECLDKEPICAIPGTGETEVNPETCSKTARTCDLCQCVE